MRSKIARFNRYQTWRGNEAAVDQLPEPRRTEIAIEWLLVIMAIRLASNLRRETFATAGKKDMKLVRDFK